MPTSNILILIPTYNEQENIEAIYQEIRAQGLSADLLFMDDNSPDGTGELAKAIAQKDPGVFCKHRFNTVCQFPLLLIVLSDKIFLFR